MLKKSVQQGRRRIETGGVPLGYVEDFDEPRTKLAGFFSILLACWRRHERISLLQRCHFNDVDVPFGCQLGEVPVSCV